MLSIPSTATPTLACSCGWFGLTGWKLQDGRGAHSECGEETLQHCKFEEQAEGLVQAAFKELARCGRRNSEFVKRVLVTSIRWLGCAGLKSALMMILQPIGEWARVTRALGPFPLFPTACP